MTLAAEAEPASMEVDAAASARERRLRGSGGGAAGDDEAEGDAGFSSEEDAAGGPARPARPPRVPRVHPYRRESPRASVGAASSSADAGEEGWFDAEEGEGELGAGVGDLSDSELAELLDV